MEKKEENLPKETIAIEKSNGSVLSDNNESTEITEEKPSMLKDLEGDKMHVLVLFFLYILQGIPLGLKDSIPLILSNRNVPYKEQATYSISSYPFSMKILWAPLVDSVYIARFGRRKSWLVPVQYLIGKYKHSFFELKVQDVKPGDFVNIFNSRNNDVDMLAICWPSSW